MTASLIAFVHSMTVWLLKGTTYAQESGKKGSAMMFALMGTVLNALGLITSIVIWIEQQRAYAVILGAAVMLIGTGIFLTGQFLDTRDKSASSCCQVHGSCCSSQ